MENENIVTWTYIMEKTIRNRFEDIHGKRKELTQNDMKDINILLRNHIYSYLIDNNLKINYDSLREYIEEVLTPYLHIDGIIEEINNGIKEIKKIISDCKKDPTVLNHFVTTLGKNIYEPPVYID